MSKVRIAIDAMGGDHAPESVTKGALLALKEWEDVHIILTGPSQELKPYLKDSHSRLAVLHTEEYIRMDEQPSAALKLKRDNSLVRALSLLREGEADAVVYAGNTGALLEASVLTLGRIAGVKRPALVTLWPVKEGGLAFLDSGANAEAKPEFLNQFAIMGSVFYKVMSGRAEARVGLLNIGSESIKGNSLYQEAHKLLSENTEILFIGNVEPEDMFNGKVDVVVADGFTGNMVLKTAEASIKFIIDKMREAAVSSPLTAIGGMMLKPKLRKIREELDYSHLGGALLIGLNGLCIKTHGKADEIAIKNAIRLARRLHKEGVLDKLKESLKRFMRAYSRDSLNA